MALLELRVRESGTRRERVRFEEEEMEVVEVMVWLLWSKLTKLMVGACSSE